MKHPYQNLRVPAYARLADLRGRAVIHNEPRPPSAYKTWRDMRYSTWRDSQCMQGLNDGAPVWYCHDGAQFRNERDAHTIARLDHTGWYCDPDQDSLAIGIVAGLSHGRFIAGYRLTMNDERVYFPEIHTDEKDAARAADEHARSIAEREREYQERWQAAAKLSDDITDKQSELCKEFALRHHKRLGDKARAAIAEIVQEIRDARETLARDFADIEV